MCCCCCYIAVAATETIDWQAMLCYLFIEGLDLLDLVVAPQENARAVVDVLRHDLEHPAHLIVDGLAAGYVWIDMLVNGLLFLLRGLEGIRRGQGMPGWMGVCA